MLNKKIINIKNILKIIILIFIIFNSLKSCAKAWTWDDLIEQTRNVYLNGYSNNEYQTNGLNIFINNIYTIENGINELGINLNDFNNFVIRGNSEGTTLVIYLINITENTSTTIVGSHINNTNSSGYLIGFIPVNNNEFRIYETYNNSTIQITNYARTVGLINENFNNYNNNMLFQNIYDYININRSNFEYANLPWYFADARQGILSQDKNGIVRYYLYDDNDNEIQELSANIISVNGGYLNQLSITSKTNLNNGGSYIVKMITNDNKVIYSSDDFILQWNENISGGGSTSGDNSSVDLEKTNNLINSVNNNITEQGQNISAGIQEQTEAINNQTEVIKEVESGNKERQSFWEKAYNDMFTVSSGEVQEVFNNIKENTNIDNMGAISGELQILNVLNGEPSDFIIKWDDIEYEGQIIIPHEQINFSQMIREIPELKSIIDWVHIIMGYIVISVLITEIWFTLLKILGVSVSIYDQQQDEIDRLNEQTITIMEDETTHYKTILERERNGNVTNIKKRSYKKI